MKPGAAWMPMPDAVQLAQAARALGANEDADATPRGVLDAAIKWLESSAVQAGEGVRDHELSTILGTSYMPAVDAVETAFAAFGLPTFQPDYHEWLERVGGHTMENGHALVAGDADALRYYLQTVQRGERFCAGYIGSMITGGGMLRAARLLSTLLDRGEWIPQWT